jgi:hypothetical protein
MQIPGVRGALLFAVLLSTGCRGAFAPGGLEASRWQQTFDYGRKTAAAKPLADVPSRKPQDPNRLVRPASHVSSAVTIPKDYLNDPPPAPPTETASSGLVQRKFQAPRSRARAFSTAARTAPMEKRHGGTTQEERATVRGGADFRFKQSAESNTAPRILEPAFDASPAADGWNEPPSSSVDGDPLRSAYDRPVVSAARWTYDRSDVQPHRRLRANPLRP